MPILHHIEGPKNILADNLLRIHRLVTPDQLAEGKKMVEHVSDEEYVSDEDYFLDEFSGVLDEDIRDSLGCYLNLPESDNPEQNPLNYPYICEQQQADSKFLSVQQRFPNNYI